MSSPAEEISAAEKAVFAAWRDDALALSEGCDDAVDAEVRETLCDFIENAELGIQLACVDRESFAGDWRAVYLKMISVDASGCREWELLDHDGTAIVEPDQDLIGGRMTEEFLLGEVKHGYYSLLTKAIVQSLSADEVEDVEDSEENDDDGDDGGVRALSGDSENAETDEHDSGFEFADGDRIKFNSQTATLRTREGSGDFALPSSKVAVLFDDRAGAFELVRREDLAASGATLLDASDDVDSRLHPALLLRGSPASKIEGTLMGEMVFSAELPSGMSEMRAFAGVWFNLRDLPIMCGHAVFAAAAVAQAQYEPAT